MVIDGQLQPTASQDLDLVARRQQEIFASAVFVTQLQQALKVLGYYEGDITGVYDEATTAAVAALQRDLGLPETGQYDEATDAALRERLGVRRRRFGTSVAQLQQALADLGFYSGPIDGRYSAETIEAVRAFQRDLGVPETGVIDVATLQAIYASGIACRASASVPRRRTRRRPRPPAATDAPPTPADRRHRTTDRARGDRPEPPTGRGATTSTRSCRPIRSSRRSSRCSTRPATPPTSPTRDPLTFFAPTNEAFDALDEETRDRLTSDPAAADELLRDLAVEGAIPSDELVTGNAAVVRRLPGRDRRRTRRRSPSTAHRSWSRTSQGSNGDRPRRRRRARSGLRWPALPRPGLDTGANMCSWDGGRRSCTPTSTRSTRRSSSATTPRLRGRPVIVGGGVVLAASYEAKAFGVRTAMGGHAGAAAVPARRRRAAPLHGLHRGQQGGVHGVRRHHAARRGALHRRGVPRRRRPAADRPAPPSRSPPACAREVRERVGLPITVGVARTKFLAKVASGVAKPDGLLVVPPGRRARRSCTRCPSSGCGASGRRRPTSSTHRGIATVGDVAARRRGPARRHPRPAAGRHLHALAHNRDPAPRRGRPAPPLDRVAAGASAAARTRAEEIDAVARRHRRPGDPAAARRPSASGARSCCGCASTTSPGPPARTPLPAADGRDRGRSWPPSGRCSPRPMPLIDERGLTLVGLAVANLDDDGAVQLDAAVRPRRAAAPSTPRSTTSASASARRRSPAPSCSAASDGMAMPLLPDSPPGYVRPWPTGSHSTGRLARRR